MIHYRYDRARQKLPAARISLQSPRLVAIVNDTINRHGIAPSRFGGDAVGDPRLVCELRGGRNPGKRIRAAILAHIERIGAGSAVRHA